MVTISHYVISDGLINYRSEENSRGFPRSPLMNLSVKPTATLE